MKENALDELLQIAMATLDKDCNGAGDVGIPFRYKASDLGHLTLGSTPESASVNTECTLNLIPLFDSVQEFYKE
jgi:hypothetical protein